MAQPSPRPPPLGLLGFMTLRPSAAPPAEGSSFLGQRPTAALLRTQAGDCQPCDRPNARFQALNTEMIHHEERAQELMLIRRRKMARSVHAYVRGSTEKFYAWLERCGAQVPAGPSIWICGDCHV